MGLLFFPFQRRDAIRFFGCKRLRVRIPAASIPRDIVNQCSRGFAFCGFFGRLTASMNGVAARLGGMQKSGYAE